MGEENRSLDRVSMPANETKAAISRTSAVRTLDFLQEAKSDGPGGRC